MECEHNWSQGWVNVESGVRVSITQVCLNKCGARQTTPIGEQPKGSVRSAVERKQDKQRTELR